MFLFLRKTFIMFFAVVFLSHTEGSVLYSLENAPGKGAIFEEKSADDEGIALNALTFSIPEHLGIVNDRWQGSSSPVVIYVQDAHCNYEAQQKLSQIVAYVNEKYGIETVDLEGGAGGYDLSALTDVADPVSRRNIADFFVKEGLVNGAEYFAANNPEKVRLWGVEDRELYMENLGVYRDSLAYREKAKGHIAELKRVIGKFKEKMYSPELLLVDEKRGEFRKNDVELAEYMAFIFGEAEKNSVDISAYPNISMLKKISDKESSIDFRKADKEKDQLVDRLKRALSKRSMEELLRWTIDLKAERMSQGEYYRRLLETARKVNVPVEDLSQLGEYVEYMSMFDSVDKSAAMKELEALDGAVREKLYKADGERELDELSRDLEILEGIFDISLVKSEYRYYMDNSGDFDVARYQSFISKYATLYGMEAAFNKEIFSLDDYRGRMIRFFEYSFRRDDAFLKNLSVRRSGGASPEAAILVTGGFHSENLCELFRNNNISYVSVMPNFRSPAGYESPYFARLAGGGSVVSVLEPAVTAASAMQVASLFSGIARDVWGDNADKSIRAAVKVMEMRGVEYLSGISKVEYADGKFTFTMKSGEEDEWSREESAELKGETLGRSSAMDIGEGVLPFRLYSWENKGDSIFSGDVSAGEIKQLVRGASSIPFVVVGEEIVDPVSGKTRIGLKEILFGSPGMAHGSMLEIYTAGKEDIPFYIGFLSQGSAVFSEKSGIPRDLKDLVTNMLLEEDLIDSGYVIAEQEERTLLFVDPFSGQAMEFNAENSKTHDDILKEFSSQLKTGLKDLSSSNMPSNNLWNMLGYDPASERHRQVIEKLQDWARQSERDQEVLSIEGIIDFYHVSTGFSHDGEKVVTVQLPAFEGWYGIFAASNRELYSKLLEYAEGARLVENFYDESKSGKRSLVDLPSVEMLDRDLLSSKKVFSLDDKEVTEKHKAVFGNKAARIGDIRRIHKEMGLPGGGSPEGFVVTTDSYRDWMSNGRKLTDEIERSVRREIINWQNKKPAGERSLSVSVRSGAAVSLPGMMDTELDVPVPEWKAGENRIDEITRDVLSKIDGIFRSWESERAVKERIRRGLSDNFGTAVTVQAMVRGDKINPEKGFTTSFTGVMKSRDPKSGKKIISGEYLENAEGKALVDGSKTPIDLSFFNMGFDPRSEEGRMRSRLYSELEKWARALEEYYGDPQEIEFTVEDGQLYILQTRSANLTPRAQFALLQEQFLGGVISETDAMRKMPAILSGMAKPSIKTEEKHLVSGIGTSPGGMLGRAAFSRESAERMIEEESLKPEKERLPVIFVAETTDVEDVDTVKKIGDSGGGVVTLKGGMTSHAAGYTYRWNIPGIVGAEGLSLENGKLVSKDGKTVISEGSILGMDGSNGNVYYRVDQDYEGLYEVTQSPLTEEIQRDLMSLGDLTALASALSGILSGEKTAVDSSDSLEIIDHSEYEDQNEIAAVGINGYISISNRDRLALSPQVGTPASVMRLVVVKKDTGEYAFVLDFGAVFHKDIMPESTHYAHGSVYFEANGGKNISIFSPVTADRFRTGNEDSFREIHKAFLEAIGSDELLSEALKGANLVTSVSSELGGKKIRSTVGVTKDSSGLIGKLYTDKAGAVMAEDIVTGISEDGKTISVVSSDGSALYDENGNEIEVIDVADRAINDEQRKEINKKIDALPKKKSALGQMESQLYNSIMKNLTRDMSGGSSILAAENMPEGVFAMPVTGTGQIVVSKAILDGILSGREAAILPMFHESGEMMKDKIENETGIVAHTFMRGVGQKVRDAINDIVKNGKFKEGMSTQDFFALINEELAVTRQGTPLTDAEKKLMLFNLNGREEVSLNDLTDEYASIYGGLQDKVFGKAANENFTKDYTSKEEARARASARAARVDGIVKAMGQVEMKHSLVKAVVGVPDNGMYEAEVTRMLGQVNSDLADLGFGLVESTSYSRQGDKRQVIPYKIVQNDPEQTRKNYEEAVKKADRMLQEQMKTAAKSDLGGDGHIVLFAPHKNAGINLDEGEIKGMEEQYGNLTVVPDAYTDYDAKSESCPDIFTRAVLARHIAFAFKSKDPLAVMNIMDFLNGVSGEKISEEEIKNIKDLAAVIKYLFNNPLKLSSVFENLVQMQESYQAVARSL